MRNLFALSLVVLGGCSTSLTSRPMANRADGGVIGMTYALPALQYRTAITHRLTKCEPSDMGGLTTDFEVTVDAKPEHVDGEWFAVDYRDLASWSKTSSFDMETYPNQTIKSFNAKADDQSPEIVAGAVKAAFSVARLALGVPGAGAVPPVEKAAGEKLKCPTQKLKSYSDLENALKARTKVLTGLTAELEPYVVESMVGTLSEEAKERISALRKSIIDETKKVADIKKKMDEVGAELSFVQTRDFLPLVPAKAKPEAMDLVVRFPSKQADQFKLQKEWAAKLFGATPSEEEMLWLGTQMKPVVLTVRPAHTGARGYICEEAGVEAGCDSPESPWWSHSLYNPGRAKPKTIPGIAYRTPIRSRLRICHSADAAECAAASSPATLKSESFVAIPQLGRLAILPFQNGFGENSELSATFRADGSLEKASYAQKRAVGVSLMNVVNGSLDQALALDTAVRERRKAALAEAEGAAAAELDKEIALLTKQKELLALQTALDPEAQEEAGELAALNARIAQLTALKALRDLEKELNSVP